MEYFPSPPVNALGQNCKEGFKVYYNTTQKKWERSKCHVGFVGCKSVKMCVLVKLPDMSSNSANIEKNRIN